MGKVIGLTIIVFYVIEAFIAFCFIYIMSLATARIVKPLAYKKIYSALLPVNRFANICLVFFPWIMIIPILEISMGFYYCNDVTYLYTYRNNCSDYPKVWYYLGAFGTVFGTIIGVTVTFFYRNYEFNEKELLKRKFSYVSVLNYIFCSFLIISYWSRIGFNIALTTTAGIIICLVY